MMSALLSLWPVLRMISPRQDEGNHLSTAMVSLAKRSRCSRTSSQSRGGAELLDKAGEWKWAGIGKYLKLVKKFEEFLLLLAHITGGQPSRGEEITGLRLINGINRDRNIFQPKTR